MIVTAIEYFIKSLSHRTSSFTKRNSSCITQFPVCDNFLGWKYRFTEIFVYNFCII